MAGFQQVDIGRMLTFEQAAAQQASITGPHISKQKFIDYQFEGTSTLYGWSSTTGTNGLTLARANLDGGAMTMTMGGTDEDCGEFYHNAIYSAASNCGMFAKLKIGAITDVCVVVGFVDRYENVDDHVAGEIDSAAFRVMDNVGDWVGLTFDTDQTTKVWYYGASKNGAEGTPVAAVGSLAPVADTYFYVCVQTDSSGNALFYYGTQIDRLAAVGRIYTATTGAIAHTASDLFAPYVGFIAHSATALVCTVSRVIVWQDN